ncbi:MAG: outer membrane protein assembly factor BamD [Planctomycetota bacterium]|nr:outer membrane protein assembly factor BamD [Planctomycetota bacterium]
MATRFCVLILLFCACSVFGQETYTLNEQTDTWELTSSPKPGSPGAQLASAAKALASNSYEDAIRLSTIWINRNKRHPLLGEAHMIRGDAFFKQGNYYESLFDYEFVASTFYGTDVEVAANARELEIGTLFANGVKRKVWGMRIADASDEAAECLMRVQSRMPRSPMAQEACMELADLYFRQNDMKLANKTYGIFLSNYAKTANAKLVSKAQSRLIDTRLATYRGPLYSNKGLVDANLELEQLQLLNPRLAKTINASARMTRFDELLAQKLLNTANWYLKTEKPISAEYTLRQMVKKYPKTSATVEALEDVVPHLLTQIPPVILEEAAPFYAIQQEAILGRTIIVEVIVEATE